MMNKDCKAELTKGVYMQRGKNLRPLKISQNQHHKIFHEIIQKQYIEKILLIIHIQMLMLFSTAQEVQPTTKLKPMIQGDLSFFPFFYPEALRRKYSGGDSYSSHLGLLIAFHDTQDMQWWNSISHQHRRKKKVFIGQ